MLRITFGSAVVGVLALVGLVVPGLSAFPRLSPNNEEQIYQSGSSFLLTCEATKDIEWKLPVLSPHFDPTHTEEGVEITTERISATDSYEYRSVLKVKNASILDTGYYVCHHKRSEEIDNPRVAVKTYVYVEDKIHLIVNVGDEGIVTVMAHQSSREVIPCKPTSPNVQLTLLDPTGTEINVDPQSNSEWSYDQHEGFIVEDVVVDMSGMYTCNALRPDNVFESITYYVSVQPATSNAPKPHISEMFSSRIALHDHFQLNCSASYDPGVTIGLKWIVPHPEGIDGERIRIGKLAVNKGIIGSMEHYIAHQVLDIFNATAEDEGSYVCKSIDHTDKSESTSVYIKIHGEDVSYVNISDIGLQSILEAPANETIKWVVNYEAYPKPQITWSKDTRENIIPNTMSKYSVKVELKRTVLEIKEVGLADSGQYLLTINTTKEEGSRNFTLRVIDKPLVKASSDTASKTIAVNDRFYVAFTIMGYPNFTANMFFRECLPQKTCSNNWTKLPIDQSGFDKSQLPNEENIKMTKVDFQTKKITLVGRARTAGEYRCEACNHLGCTGKIPDKASAIQISVNDLSNGNSTELLPSHHQNPVAGESFNLTCGVSLYHFKRQITWWWKNANGKTTMISEIQKPLGAQLFSRLKKFSYSEDLVWSDISKAASGTYICQTTSLGNTMLNTSVPLEVISGEPPKIYNSSTDVSIEQFTELSLYCNARGLPVPKAEWTKDNSPLNEGILDTPTGSTLHIRYANISHSGTYTCRFRNINGTDEHTMMVEIREKPIHAGIIVAIVIVILIVVVLIAVLGKKIHQDKKRKEFFRANQLDMFDKGNPDSINPDLPIDEQTELLPYDKRWEFPRERLKLGKQLGAGAFGRVVKGEAIGLDSGEPVTTVAVKMVRSHGNMIGLKALMSELKIMIHMGSHLNVVNVRGACTKNVTKGELLVIVEYCRFGNIQNYLIRNRANFINQVDTRGYINSAIGAERIAELDAQRGYPPPRSPLGSQADKDYCGSPTGATEISFLSMSPTGGGTGQSDLPEGIDSNGHPTLTSNPSNASGNQPYPPWRSNYRGDYRDLPEQPLCTRDLLCWAFQIARGMDYLARRKILHGDLAARNVLLADNNVVKIADFGLAREVYRSGNYKKKGEGPLPVKWMAIESIVDRVFSTQSDVWSFGIVLWELFSLGKTPYPGMEADEQFFMRLQQGYRMEKPKYAPNKIYEIMKDCWLHDPTGRPDFITLADTLGSQLDTSLRRHYIDLNDAYVASNNIGESPDYLSMMSPVNYVNVGGVSPMPPRQAYANLPPQTDESNGPPSDYLTMGNVSLSDDAPPTDGYLFMTNSRPTSADSNFDFQFAPKLRKVNEELTNSVEMRPMLGRSPISEPSNPGVIGQHTNGFSNPNYANPPVIKCSDLDDLPLSPKKTPIGNQTYVNIAQSPTNENDEPYYANPKNNARIV